MLNWAFLHQASCALRASTHSHTCTAGRAQTRPRTNTQAYTHSHTLSHGVTHTLGVGLPGTSRNVKILYYTSEAVCRPLIYYTATAHLLPFEDINTVLYCVTVQLSAIPLYCTVLLLLYCIVLYCTVTAALLVACYYCYLLYCDSLCFTAMKCTACTFRCTHSSCHGSQNAKLLLSASHLHRHH